VSPKAAKGDSAGEGLVLRLYVAGAGPNSERARANLEALRGELEDDGWRLEVVDVLEEPLRALQEGVLVTPTLRKLAPPPEQTIIGDLSDSARVRAALGLGAEEP
jgi:circadian clock protein KaiB